MRLARIKICAVLISSAVLCLFLWAARTAPVFEGGLSYELYTGTSSAEIVSTNCPALAKLFRADIRGESVRYAGDRLHDLMERFSPEICFTEEAAGVTNYYCYTPSLGHGIALRGHIVNLHIAVGEGYTAAGTPLIFGGY